MPKGVYVRKLRPVYGVGVNDLRLSSKRNRNSEYDVRVYNLWTGILSRCYSKYKLEKEPSYKGCVVCDKWMKISAFKADLPTLPGYDMWLNNPNKKISIDKDLRGNGKRIYSPETCCFVTLADNIRERNNRVGNPAHNRKRPVICVYTDGTKKFYDSIVATEKDGFVGPNVSMCLKETRRTHRGCKFYYA